MKRLVRPKVIPPKIESLTESIIKYPTYQDYLLSPRWTELREQALVRDGRRCRVCNSSKFVQVHHRKYPKVWGEETVEDLTSLCDNCHNLFSLKALAVKTKDKISKRKIKKKEKSNGSYNSWARRILLAKGIKSDLKGKIKDTAKTICEWQGFEYPNQNKKRQLDIIISFCQNPPRPKNTIDDLYGI